MTGCKQGRQAAADHNKQSKQKQERDNPKQHDSRANSTVWQLHGRHGKQPQHKGRLQLGRKAKETVTGHDKGEDKLG